LNFKGKKKLQNCVNKKKNIVYKIRHYSTFTLQYDIIRMLSKNYLGSFMLKTIFQ